jgi:hypothetical protein
MKKVISFFTSVTLGAILSIYPGMEAIKSQSQQHFLVERPAPVIEEVDSIFEPLIGSETAAGDEGNFERTHFYNDPDIPDEVEEAAELSEITYHILPELIEATLEHESGFRLNATAETDLEHSVGPAQVNLKCKDHLDRIERLGLTVEDLKTYEGAVKFNADYLGWLFANYEDPAEVLMRYNGDKTGLQQYWKDGTISDYAQEILERAEELEAKHGKK